MDTRWYPTTLQPSRRTVPRLPPATHLHPRRASCWVIPRCSSLARELEPPPPAEPLLLLLRQPGPPSPSSRSQRPTSAPAPLQLPLGRSAQPPATDGPKVLVRLGGGGPLGGVGGALRPRTHFIPSHLYWISRISGLRELVYPIRLHCKGRLPASSLTARGHGMLCWMCMGTRLGVGGVGGAARGTISSLHHNSLPQTLAAVAGLLAPMGVPNGCPCGPILLHANNWPWWHSHRGPTWSPTVLRMEGQGPTPPPPPPTMGGALRIAY